MRVKVEKLGKNLGIRIPRNLAKSLNLKAGDTVEIDTIRGCIVLTDGCAPAYRLEDLLANMAKENLHDFIDVGGPVVRELF